MEEVEKPMERKLILQALKQRWDTLYYDDKWLRMKESATECAGRILPSKVFSISSPALACEEDGPGKVALIKQDEADFPSAFFYIERDKLEELRRQSQIEQVLYPRRIFKAMLGTDGQRFLLQYRAAKRAEAEQEGRSNFIAGAKTIFNKAFLQTILGKVFRHEFDRLLTQCEINWVMFLICSSSATVWC